MKLTSKMDGALSSSSWLSNGFDGVAGPPIHPAVPLSKWTEFEGAAEATASKSPPTNGNHPFGSLSCNSFFSRHNPHPFRVTHLKGLFDTPICVVNDDGYIANPRYALQFPPNNFVQTKINRWETGDRKKTPGFGLITPNISNRLQSKRTKNKYGDGVWRKKHSIPYNGKEAWRDELKMLTEALMKASNDENVRSTRHLDEIVPATGRAAFKNRPSQYSAETGRIIPSSSLSRGRLNSRRQSMKSSEQLEQIIEQSSSEVLVLQLLCQILETEDVNEVQKWLTTAPNREKSFAFELLKLAVSIPSKDQLQSGHQPFQLLPSVTEEQCVQLTDQRLPPVNSNRDSVNGIDRLIIDHEADQENQIDSKSRGPTETEQRPCKNKKDERPTHLQHKMSQTYISKISSSRWPMTGSNQTGLQKDKSASKSKEAGSPPLKGKEAAGPLSEKARGDVLRLRHQSPDRSTREPEDIDKPDCRPTFQRSLTIV